MRKLLLWGMLLLVGILVTWCSSSQTKTESDKMSVYRNKEYNFTVKFPLARSFEENSYGSTVIFLSPQEKNAQSRVNIGINVQRLSSSGVALDELFAANKKTLEKVSKDISIEKESDLTIGKIPAKKIIYTIKEGKFTIKQATYITIKDKKAYIFTYTALENKFNDYANIAEQTVTSFTF